MEIYDVYALLGSMAYIIVIAIAGIALGYELKKGR